MRTQTVVYSTAVALSALLMCGCAGQVMPNEAASSAAVAAAPGPAAGDVISPPKAEGNETIKPE
jgi:hypothetical protein